MRPRGFAERSLEEQKLVEELAVAGFELESIDQLVNSKRRYARAIPILLRTLPAINDIATKESIVRALAVPEARGMADRTLLAEFRRVPADPRGLLLKWAIGNALSVVASPRSFSEIASLIEDEKNGMSREMLVVSLARMSPTDAVPLLLDLVRKNHFVGHALIALRRLGAVNAERDVAALTKHEVAWVRNEAKKTLATFRRLRLANSQTRERPSES